MRFINKKVNKRQPYMFAKHAVKGGLSNKDNANLKDKPKKIKAQKKEVMTTQEKINAANEALSVDMPVKRIKRDKGLIERTESSKTILTEDNKELLTD